MKPKLCFAMCFIFLMLTACGGNNNNQRTLDEMYPADTCASISVTGDYSTYQSMEELTGTDCTLRQEQPGSGGSLVYYSYEPVRLDEYGKS